MATARHARRRRRRYYQALAHEQRRHHAQGRVEPAHRADDRFVRGIAWTAIVVLALVAIVVAAPL